MVALEKVPKIVWYGVGALMLANAAQTTANSANTAAPSAFTTGMGVGILFLWLLL